ncbi:MAG: hypothetical protein HQ478_16295, partial [Chloroflexi bacterium]|nr:hypothetical protein [Chloroflexota bacterium]
GNYRDMELNRRHPLSITLGELSRERLFERVLLRGLQKHDVQRFIEVAAGIDPPSALVDAVHTQTEGNPLFVTETVRLLIQEGDITSGAQTEGGTSSWEIRIPEGVREVIGRRLDRLSERCNEVLTMASVVGRQFQFGLLMNLVDDASENMLLDVMDEALEARIIEEVPSEVGLYQFAHALMQETLSSELSANRTVRLHARIAEALEEFYGDKADQHAADLVEHFAEAEIVLGSDRLIKYGSVAVKEALRLFAFEEAAYTGGRALQSSSDGVDSVEVAELHLMTGKANGGLRNLDVAIGHFEAAFEMYEVLGDHAGMIEVGSYNFVSGVGQVAMLPLLERAMAIAVPNTAEHGQLLSSHGVSISMYRDRYADGLAEFEQAERIALDNDDHQLLLRVQTDAGLAAQWGSDFEAAFARSKAAVDIARDDDDPLGLSMANVSLSLFSEFEGDREQADLYRSRAIELADRSGDRQRMSTVRGTGARNLSARGDWDAARRYGLESLEFYPEDSRTISTLAMVEAETGNFSEARKYSDQLTGQDEHGFASLRALEVAELSGDETWIAEMVEQTDGIDDTIHQSPSTNTSRDLMRVRRAPYELSSAQMVDLYNEVEQLRHRDMIGRGAEQAFLSIGRLAAACEFSEKALEWFESGLSFARKANRPPNIAWHAYEIAGVLLERGGDGDSERAGELQDEAIAIATELGMKPLLERVLAQREILKA